MSLRWDILSLTFQQAVGNVVCGAQGTVLRPVIFNEQAM